LTPEPRRRIQRVDRSPCARAGRGDRGRRRADPRVRCRRPGPRVRNGGTRPL